jgi:hypothetical protein
MRFRRKIVTVVVSLTCGLALAACGQQVVAHIEAGDSVHSALTSVFDSPTTQFVITGQDLPGQASIADHSLSVVLTISNESGPGASTSTGDQSVDVSVNYETAYLVDLRSINGSEYCRLDLKYIEGLVGPATFAAESRALDELAARPGFGFIHDVLLGNWVGVSTSTLTAVARQLAPEVPGADSSISGLQRANGLGLQIANSLAQSVRTWLSIHETTTGEYSLSLPIRSLAGSVLQGMAKALATDSNEPFLSPSQLSKAIDEIPAKLSIHANLWIANGSVSKAQVFIPNSSGSLLIAVSHPAASVQVPANATMLTAANLTAVFGTLWGPLVKALGSNGGGLFTL